MPDKKTDDKKDEKDKNKDTQKDDAKKDDKKDAPKEGPVTGEELEKRCIKYAIMGLVSCGLESSSAYDNFCRTSGSGAEGDRPSMGLQGWEGLGGGAGDQLLIKLGLSQYANKTYTELVNEGADTIIKQTLGSEQGKKVQLEYASETQSNYLSIMKKHGWTVNPDGKSTVFVLMWMGCAPYAVAERLQERGGNGLDLEGINQWFLSNWMGAAGESCREGYTNRNNKTYEYCKQIDMNKDPNPDMMVNLSGGGGGSGMTIGSFGYGIQVSPVGTDMVKITKLQVGKTFPCEPVYPDLITVSDTVPQWVLDMTVVAANEQARKELEVGNSSQTMQELEQDKKDVEEFNKLKEDQFVKWLKDNGHGYTNEEQLKQCKEMYEQAAKANPEQFKDGIYFGKDDKVKAKIEECQKKEKVRNDRLNGKTTKKEESSKTEEKKDDNQKQKENSKVVEDEYNPPSSSGPVGANTAPKQKNNKELVLEEYNRKIEQSGSRMVKKMEALRSAWMKANGKNYVDVSNAAILEWGKANSSAEYSQYMEEKNTHDTLQKKYYEVYNS